MDGGWKADDWMALLERWMASILASNHLGDKPGSRHSGWDANMVMTDPGKSLSKAERHSQGVVHFRHAMFRHSAGRIDFSGFRVHKPRVIKGSDLKT